MYLLTGRRDGGNPTTNVSRYPGGLEAYAALFPKVFCADEHLTRVGFMGRCDLRGFTKHVLSVAGLGDAFKDDRFWVKSGVVAIVEQSNGVWSTGHEPWLEYAEGDQKVCWCWLKGPEPGELVTPPGWYPDPSMTKLSLEGATGALGEEEDIEDAGSDGKGTVTLYQARFFPESEDNY